MSSAGCVPGIRWCPRAGVTTPGNNHCVTRLSGAGPKSPQVTPLPCRTRGREPSGDQSPQSQRAGTRFWQRERGLAVPEGRSSELTEKGPLWEGEVSSRAVETLRVTPAQSWRGHDSCRDHSLDLAAGVPAGQAPLAPPGPWLRSVVSCLLCKGPCPGPCRVCGGSPTCRTHLFILPVAGPPAPHRPRVVDGSERGSMQDPCFCVWRGCGLGAEVGARTLDVSP